MELERSTRCPEVSSGWFSRRGGLGVLDQAANHGEEAVAGGAARANLAGIPLGQDVWSVPRLVVAPWVRVLGGSPQGVSNVNLQDIFERLAARESFGAKAVSVVASQRRKASPVSEIPCMGALVLRVKRLSPDILGVRRER